MRRSAWNMPSFCAGWLSRQQWRMRAMSANTTRISRHTSAMPSRPSVQSLLANDDETANTVPGMGIATGSRQEICVTSRNPRELKEEVIKTLLAANEPPELYVFAKGLARVRSDRYSSP